MVRKLEERMSWPEVVERTAQTLEKFYPKEDLEDFKQWFMHKQAVGRCGDAMLPAFAWGISKSLKAGQDYFAVIVGKEGSGKSTLSFLLSSLVDPAFSLSKVHYDQKTYFRNLRYGEKLAAQVIDEGGISLFGREALSKSNVELNKFFTVMRQKQNLTIINIPDYAKLDRGVRSRVDVIFRTMHHQGGFRYAAYWGAAVKKINEDMGRRVSGIEQVKVPNGYFSYGYFRKDFPPTIDQEEYLKRKEGEIDAMLDAFLSSDSKDVYLTAPEVCRLLKISRESLRKWLLDGRLKGYRVGNKVLLKRREVMKLVESSKV